MSFRLGLDRVQEIIVFGLMVIFFIAVFYSDISFHFKIVISGLVFSIILLVGLANQVSKQRESLQF